MKNIDKAKKLYILWWVSFGIVSTIGAIYTHIYTFQNGYPPTETLGVYHLALTFLVLAYFYPLLFIVHRYARHGNSRKTLYVVRFLMVWLSVWLVLNLISTAQEIFHRIA